MQNSSYLRCDNFTNERKKRGSIQKAVLGKLFIHVDKNHMPLNNTEIGFPTRTTHKY